MKRNRNNNRKIPKLKTVIYLILWILFILGLAYVFFEFFNQ